MTDSYKTSKGYTGFCSQGYTQIVENVRNDTSLSDDAKKCFFDHLMLYNGLKEEDVKTHFRPFFHSRKLTNAPIFDFEYSDEVGYAMPFDIFHRFLQRVFPGKDNDMIESDINAYCCRYYEQDAKIIRDYISVFSSSNTIETKAKISGYLMWTFKRLDGSKGVYDESRYSKKDLPCLLGLEIFDSNGDQQKYVTFSLKIPPDINVHKPTAFDAGLNIYWRPGGKTKKHDDAPEKYRDIDGFEEFVHHPVCFEDIQSCIYKLYDNE